MTNLVAKSPGTYAKDKGPSRADLSRRRRIQALYKDLALRREELEPGEKEVLIPQLRGRAEYMLKRFKELKRIASDKDLPHVATESFRQLLPTMEPERVSTQEVRRRVDEFLLVLQGNIEENFIGPLTALLGKYQKVEDVPAFRRFLIDLHLLCMAITATEGELFKYRVAIHLHVTDKRTGKVVRDEPAEYSVFLMPFRLAIDELQRVAAATADSIDHWREKQEEARKPFLEYLTAFEAQRATSKTVMVQWTAVLLALAFSIFFIYAEDPFRQLKANEALQRQLTEAHAREVLLESKLRLAEEQLRAQSEQTTQATSTRASWCAP